ncbi:MAG: hypothetical protein R6V23_14195 [Bacteroidales bacterium]
MEKQDYLKRQIDQLGKVLSELLAKLTGSGKNTDASETLEIVSQVLDENLDWDIEQLLNIPENEFIDRVKENRLLNNANLETLADVLVAFANHYSLNKDGLLKRALIIYKHIEKSNKTFSFTRNQKMEKVRGLLK